MIVPKPKAPKGLSLAEQLKANQSNLVAKIEVKQNAITMPKFGNPMEEMMWMNSDAGKEWKANQKK